MIKKQKLKELVGQEPIMEECVRNRARAKRSESATLGVRKMEKEDIKKIEDTIKEYKGMERLINHYELDIMELEHNVQGYKSESLYAGELFKKDKKYSTVENEIIRKERKLEELRRDKKLLEISKKRMDLIINKLTEQEKKVFEAEFSPKGYITKREKIYRLNFGKDTYYKHRKNMLEKLYEELDLHIWNRDI
ncbi:hypothetical protein [Peptostreptococcus faecalis]|uniref:hypothetical protein n=1 Tax=Peptostreptococcus faecalis TaxID=2045015 RepID=UPI000C7BF14E|nr:hypothetical protein [Peptostreptococcus faecalis]